MRSRVGGREHTERRRGSNGKCEFRETQLTQWKWKWKRHWKRQRAAETFFYPARPGGDGIPPPPRDHPLVRGAHGGVHPWPFYSSFNFTGPNEKPFATKTPPTPPITTH